MSYDEVSATEYEAAFNAAKKKTKDWGKKRGFEKEIFNYNGKGQKIVYAILQSEVLQLITQNKGFELDRFDKPIFTKYGSAIYTIHLKKQS